MKKLIAAAALLAFGGVALASANGDGLPADAPASMRAAAPATPVADAATASARVRVAFAAPAAAAQTEAPTKGAAQAHAPNPELVSRRTRVEPARPRAAAWYGRDPSLRRGDVVVTENGALVFEGEKGGKRRFRTIGMSRLVSTAERDQILKGVPR